MQFLPKCLTGAAVVFAALLIAVPVSAQTDMDKKNSSKGDAATRARSPDVTGRPPMNSPDSNRTPAKGGPGVNPNVEDKSAAAKQAAQKNTRKAASKKSAKAGKTEKAAKKSGDSRKQ